MDASSDRFNNAVSVWKERVAGQEGATETLHLPVFTHQPFAPQGRAYGAHSADEETEAQNL